MKAKEQLHTSPDSWDKMLPSRLHIRPFPSHGSLSEGTTMGPSVAEWGSLATRRCHRALGEGGAAVRCQGIMHRPCGRHNVVFISLTLQRGNRQNNPDSVSKVLWGVQASLMKMNKTGESAFAAQS